MKILDITNFSLEEGIEELKTYGWEFSLRYEANQFRLIMWKPEWATSDLYQSRACPAYDSDTANGCFLLALTSVESANVPPTLGVNVSETIATKDKFG